MTGIADFVPQTVHRALAYIDALNRQGYLPTKREVDRLATLPEPTQATYRNTWGGLGALKSFDKLLKEEVLRPAEPVVSGTSTASAGYNTPVATA